MLEVTLKNVINVPRVRPLSADFSITIKDQDGELIAEGTTEMIDMDVLQPVSISNAVVTRMSQELAQPTDIVITFHLANMDIMANSVLQLLMPKDMLDLNGAGSC